jgi:hypothetical protein
MSVSREESRKARIVLCLMVAVDELKAQWPFKNPV